MSAIVFTVQKDATDYATAVDSKYGYPKPGVDIGAGIHASPVESTTTTYAAVIKHPTLPQWAYTDASPAATSVQKPTPDVAVPVTGTVQSLDATWFPVVATASVDTVVSVG